MTEQQRAAMQAALEALEAELHPGWQCNSYHPLLIKATKALRAALAEPQPEPVAWLHKWKPHAAVIGKSLHWNAISPHGDDMEITPLYAAPPAQQPLTDGQIDAAYCESQNQDLRPQDKSRVFAFARAIERAHGIGK